jgi:hypothetical protein
VTRRSLGRGRLIVAVGALVCLAGTLPAWWTVGGTVTPSISGNAFEGAGILVFIACLGLLALIVLPFATRDGESRLDRPASYVALTAVAITGFVLRVLEINSVDALGLPDRAPGMWLSGVGLLIVAWGVAEILTERPREP